MFLKKIEPLLRTNLKPNSYNENDSKLQCKLSIQILWFKTLQLHWCLTLAN